MTKINFKELYRHVQPIAGTLLTCMSFLLDGVVIITTPASPLPIELVAITENV